MKAKSVALFCLFPVLLASCGNKPASEPSSPVSEPEPSVEPYRNEWGVLQTGDDLIEQPCIPQTWVTASDLAYSEEGEIIGFYTQNWDAPDPFFWPCTLSGLSIKMMEAAESNPSDDDTEYSLWSKDDDAFRIEKGHKARFGVFMVLKAGEDDPHYYGYDEYRVGLNTAELTLFYDESLLSIDKDSYGARFAYALEEGETYVTVTYRDISIQKKVIVYSYHGEECYLTIRTNAPDDVFVYLSNGNPYHKGDLITIEYPVVIAYDGAPPKSEYKYKYFNGESLTTWLDTDEKFFRVEGKRYDYYRVTFSLPPFDSELLIIDGKTL